MAEAENPKPSQTTEQTVAEKTKWEQIKAEITQTNLTKIKTEAAAWDKKDTKLIVTKQDTETAEIIDKKEQVQEKIKMGTKEKLNDLKLDMLISDAETYFIKEQPRGFKSLQDFAKKRDWKPFEFDNWNIELKDSWKYYIPLDKKILDNKLLKESIWPKPESNNLIDSCSTINKPELEAYNKKIQDIVDALNKKANEVKTEIKPTETKEKSQEEQIKTNLEWVNWWKEIATKIEMLKGKEISMEKIWDILNNLSKSPTFGKLFSMILDLIKAFNPNFGKTEVWQVMEDEDKINKDWKFDSKAQEKLFKYLSDNPKTDDEINKEKDPIKNKELLDVRAKLIKGQTENVERILNLIWKSDKNKDAEFTIIDWQVMKWTEVIIDKNAFKEISKIMGYKKPLWKEVSSEKMNDEILKILNPGKAPVDTTKTSEKAAVVADVTKKTIEWREVWKEYKITGKKVNFRTLSGAEEKTELNEEKKLNKKDSVKILDWEIYDMEWHTMIQVQFWEQKWYVSAKYIAKNSNEWGTQKSEVASKKWSKGTHKA